MRTVVVGGSTGATAAPHKEPGGQVWSPKTPDSSPPGEGASPTGPVMASRSETTFKEVGVSVGVRGATAMTAGRGVFDARRAATRVGESGSITVMGLMRGALACATSGMFVARRSGISTIAVIPAM